MNLWSETAVAHYRTGLNCRGQRGWLYARALIAPGWGGAVAVDQDLLYCLTPQPLRRAGVMCHTWLAQVLVVPPFLARVMSVSVFVSRRVC